jgi:segregation and condensation protein A
MPDEADSEFAADGQTQLSLDLLPTLPSVASAAEPNIASGAEAKADAVDGQSADGSGQHSPDFSSLLQAKNSGGIEILVEMAHRGEIDPKNIDIIDATDRFLKAIAAAPKENLRQSGKIIFHASVLLRMKAEALLITRIEDLDQGGDDFVDFDTDGSPIIYDSNDEAVGRQITLADLQRALVRRSRQKQSRQRRVTLEQLIESLREAERLEKKRLERKEREPKAVIHMDGFNAIENIDDILELAHEEDIEDAISRIEQILARTLQAMMRLSLLELVELLEGRGDWVDAFLAALFLTNAGKIELEQEVFYGPLYLVRGGERQAQEADVGQLAVGQPPPEPPAPSEAAAAPDAAAALHNRAPALEKPVKVPEVRKSTGKTGRLPKRGEVTMPVSE